MLLKSRGFWLSVLVENTNFVSVLSVFSYVLFIFSVLFRYAPNKEQNMDDTHRDILRNILRPNLLRDVEPRKLLPYMGNVFDQRDEEEIKAQKTRTDEVEKMLEILTKKGPNAFDEFVEALSRTKSHLVLTLIQETGKR